MSVWQLVVGLLIGAATGGWWSRRRAVASSFTAGMAEGGKAAALAQAYGGHVFIGQDSR